MANGSLVTPRRVGFAAAGLGAAVGGTVGGAVGYYAVVEPVEHAIGGPLFVFAMLFLVFGLISPLTWFVFLRDQFEEPLVRWALAIAGNLLVVSFAYCMAYFGVFQALGITTPREAIAFFDALGGATFLGLGLGRYATRRVDDHRKEADHESTWDEAGTGRFDES